MDYVCKEPADHRKVLLEGTAVMANPNTFSCVAGSVILLHVLSRSHIVLLRGILSPVLDSVSLLPLG